MANIKQKITFFESVIADYSRKSGREELPWRKPGITAYEIWVSEIMLQQTQVSRVIMYYQRFLKKFPTVQILAKSSWENFLPYYEGLGYYARGRNMLKAAKIVVENFQGEFPNTKSELLTLPGVGDYTASAILSFAYGKQEVAWDTNVKRVAGRFFYGDRTADIEREKFESALTMPAKKLNGALMDFGSSICTSRPKCANCPLQSKCTYFRTRGKKEQSVKKEKTPFLLNEADVFIFLHENHKKYFSFQQKKFQPFILPASQNTRPAIKQFFFENYHLQVSVRPPHKKMLIKERPTIFVNAQILSGKENFYQFSKSEVTEYTKSISN